MPALEGSRKVDVRVCGELPDSWATRARELRDAPILATGVTPWQEGQPTTVLQSTAAAQALRLDHAATDFYWPLVEPEGRPPELLVHLRPGARWEVAEIQLLGTVLALQMELQGRLALHASAVAIDVGSERAALGPGGLRADGSAGKVSAAVLFLAAHGGGKTTLALDFVRAGADLVADDLSIVELEPGEAGGSGDSGGAKVWPAFPQMRLWPDHAATLLGEVAERLSPVLPGAPKLRVPVACEGLPGGVVGSLETTAQAGSFRRRPVPLRRLYLPQREESAREARIEAVRIEPLSGPEMLMEVLRAAFVGGLLERLQDPRRRQGRLDLAAGLLSRVPMKRLIYPSGLEHLSAVRAAVEKDLASG